MRIEAKHNGIEYFIVSAISFKTLIDLAGSVVGQASDRNKLLNRLRIFKQAIPFDDKGTPVKVFTEIELAALPPKIGIKIARAINEVMDTKEDPKIIQDGDGITEPVLFKLAEPLTVGKELITELEFMVKTFGDIEAVFAENDPGEQCIRFIETVAKPVSSGQRLQVLPSWALEKISSIDGTFISQKILPRFLA